MQVVVIGAGVIGAAVAEALAIKGCDVVVLEMRAPGRGASQASAGILAPFTEAHRGSPLLALGTRSLTLFDAWMARLRDRTPVAPVYARTGTVEVAFSDESAAALAAQIDWLTADRVEAQWLDPEELRVCVPAVAHDAAGGLQIPVHGYVGVAGLVHALLTSAREAGAVIETPTEVVRVDAAPSGPVVRAGARAWTPDRVVLAGGAWSGRVKVSGAPRLPVRPVRGQLLHLAWKGEDLPRPVVWGPDCYAVPWPDGSLLVGATVEEVGFDETSTVEGVGAMADAASRLLPSTRAASVAAVRVGLRPAMPDGLPAIGWLTPSVAVAAGHYRNGILLAPLTADLVARLVADDDSDPALRVTDPARSYDDAGAIVA